MTIDYASFGGSIMRLVAAEAVASTETSRLLRRSAHQQELAQTHQANFERDSANAQRSASGWVNCAQSIASAAQAIGNVGTEAHHSSQQNAQSPAIRENYTEAIDGGDAGREAFENTPLGSSTVGERFDDAQIDALLAEPGSEADYRAAGFTEAESRDLAALPEGEARAEAVTQLLWKHRDPPAVQAADDRRDKIIGMIQTIFTETGTRSADLAADEADGRAGRHEALAQHAQALATGIMENARAHERQLVSIESDFRKTQARGV
jgi:hypothetical protein